MEETEDEGDDQTEESESQEESPPWTMNEIKFIYCPFGLEIIFLS